MASDQRVNQCSRVEAQAGRRKMVIGPRMHARTFDDQKTEAKTGTQSLNKMTAPDRATFELVA